MSTVDTTGAAKTAPTDIQIQLAYPTMRRAAEILGVDVSAISRRAPAAIEVGPQRRLSARTVLGLAAYYNRRDLLEVGGELVEVAEEQHPAAQAAVEEEVGAFLRERRARVEEPAGRWLEEAERFLPAELFEQVREAYERGGRPRSVSGLPPR